MKKTRRTPAAGARALGLSLVLALASVPAAAGDPQTAAQEPFVDTLPNESAVCPAIEEDFDLCANDLRSGDCASFVSAAASLGRLYLFNAERQPQRTDELRRTIWWQCGTHDFFELKGLLLRIGSPAARKVLQSEPYRSIPAVRFGRPDEAAPGAAPWVPEDCDALVSDADRDACEARELAAAKAAHLKLYQACVTMLPEAQRSQLESQEREWRASLGFECTDSPCLANAIRQHDDAMKADFPACGPPQGETP